MTFPSTCVSGALHQFSPDAFPLETAALTAEELTPTLPARSCGICISDSRSAPGFPLPTKASSVCWGNSQNSGKRHLFITKQEGGGVQVWRAQNLHPSLDPFALVSQQPGSYAVPWEDWGDSQVLGTLSQDKIF